MATNNSPNSNYLIDAESQEGALEKNQQMQYFFFRLFPFWPLIFFALALGILAGYLALRLATPVYRVNIKMVVNDDDQQGGSALPSILRLDSRDLSTETEREIEILRSADILKQVVSKLQLNVSYSLEGNIKTGEAYNTIPVVLELQSPDSIKRPFAGEIEIVDHKIKFNDELFPTDSFVQSRYGTIKWSVNERYRREKRAYKWYVSVNTVASTAWQMKGSLSITPNTKGSSILNVGYTDPFPQRGIIILKTLVEVYGNSWLEYKSRIYDNTQRFLDGRLALINDELSGVEKRLQAYKATEHIVDLGAEGSLYLNKLRQADSKIGEIEIQLEVLSEIEKYVNLRNTTSDAVPATLGISDPVLLALLNQLYQAEFDLEKVRQVSGNKNPQVDVYEQLIAKLKPSIIASINNLKANLQTTKRKLESDNAEITATMDRMPEKERILLDINRQQGIKNAIYTFLLQKKEEAAIAAASLVPKHRVIETPDFGGLIAPIAQNYYTISIAIALILAIIYIYMKEFANSKLLFRSQIESRTDIPIIGELIYKESKDSPIVVGEGKRTLIAEQFRELRTNLSFSIPATEGNKGKVVLVTSSVPSEGKSFVAANTAVSICLTGAKVVLLEFDLRKPKISKPLGIKREPGISNYLVGNAKETDIIQLHNSIANFYVIASGPVPPNPAELIGSPKLAQLISYLKDHFDYILIDSPPVASVTDAKLLAVYADVTMFIIRHNFTNSLFLRLINDINQKKSIPNINIVFNGIVTKKVLGYSYGKGYGYGYSYGYGYGYGYGYIVEDKTKTWWQKLAQWLFRWKK